MSGNGEAARAAWARLLQLDRLDRLTVVVAPESYLGWSGWIGILGLDETVTATVPSLVLRDAVAEALDGLRAEDAIRPEVVRPRLPTTRSVRGPARLFYPPRGHEIEGLEDDPSEAPAEAIPRPELDEFFATVTPDDLEESGLAEVVGPVFGSRTAAGDLAAASGHRPWPNGVAHLSVLADPQHRRRGHARRAAAAAIGHATDEGLLPQWRARRHPSQALAHRLGLMDLGAQLSFEPA